MNNICCNFIKIELVYDCRVRYIRCSKKKSIIFEIEWKNNGFLFTIPNVKNFISQFLEKYCYNTNYIVCRYNKKWLVFGPHFYNNFLLLSVLFTVTFHVEKKQILYNVSTDMIPRTSQPISFT